MRAVMLEHPETAGKVAVLLHRGVHLGFEKARVSRPRHQFVADGVAQVQHARLSRWNIRKQSALTWALRKKCHERDNAGGENARAAEDIHFSPQWTAPRKHRGSTRRKWNVTVSRRLATQPRAHTPVLCGALRQRNPWHGHNPRHLQDFLILNVRDRRDQYPYVLQHFYFF